MSEILVKIDVIDSQGSPCATKEERMQIDLAAKNCENYNGGFCVSANSMASCNLTDKGCRNIKPQIIERLK